MSASVVFCFANEPIVESTDRLLYELGCDEDRMINSKGGESGIVIDSNPALTPFVPVSQTSESLSTFLSPEMLIAFQDDLEVSTQGIASAKAVRHDNSWPSIAAASTSRQPRPSQDNLLGWTYLYQRVQKCL